MPKPRKKISPKTLFLALGGAILLEGIIFATKATLQTTLIHRMLVPRLIIDHSATAVTISPDGRTIVTREQEPVTAKVSVKPPDARVWDARTGRLVRNLQGPFSQSFDLALSPDGSQAVAEQVQLRTRSGERLVAWDVASGRTLWTTQGSGPLCYSPDGKRIACCADIIDATSHKLLCHTLAQPSDMEGQSLFTPDGKLLGIVDGPLGRSAIKSDGTISDDEIYAHERLHFWRADTGQEAFSLPYPRVLAFDIAPDGKWLIMTSGHGAPGGNDGSIVRRVDMATGKVAWTRTRTMQTDSAANVISIAISRNGKYAVLLDGAGALVVIDAATGRDVFRPAMAGGGSGPGWAVPGGLAFSADGRTLVSRSFDKVLVWDASALQ